MIVLSKFAVPALGILALSLPIGLIYAFKGYLYSEDDYSCREVNEILFFSNEGSTCRSHLRMDKDKKVCSLPNCSFYNLSVAHALIVVQALLAAAHMGTSQLVVDSVELTQWRGTLYFRRMLYYLDNAKQSLDICLYLITVRDLSEAVVKAKRRGVKVRVVTDEDMANASGSTIPTFKQNGLSVKTPRNATTLMHHKFVLIDKEILMTGSLNWTMQAICGNWDNLLITSNPSLVQGFVRGFNSLWDQLK